MLSLKPSIFICDSQPLSAVLVPSFSQTLYFSSLLCSNSYVGTEQSLHLPNQKKNVLNVISSRHLTKANTNMQKLKLESSIYHPATVPANNNI